MSGEFEYWQKPHWTNRDDYPADGNSLVDWRWRWEFLRRDPDYQRAWQRGGPTTHAPDDRIRKAHPLDVGAMHVWRGNNLINPTLDVSGLRNVFAFSGGGTLLYRMPYREFLDIVSKYPGEEILDTFMSGLDELDERLESGAVVTALFDMSRPLEPQVKRVSHLLKEKQKLRRGKLVQFRRRRNLWPTYLRLLDAEHQGNPRPMAIYKRLLQEAKSFDVEAYDDLAVSNPATLIADWQEQAREVRNKIIIYL